MLDDEGDDLVTFVAQALADVACQNGSEKKTDKNKRLNRVPAQ